MCGVANVQSCECEILRDFFVNFALVTRKSLVLANIYVFGKARQHCIPAFTFGGVQ